MNNGCSITDTYVTEPSERSYATFKCSLCSCIDSNYRTCQLQRIKIVWSRLSWKIWLID